MDSAFLTCIIDAYKEQDVMSADAHNAFVQAMFPRSPGEDWTIMKITGRLADVLVNMHQEVHKNYAALKKPMCGQ